MSRQEIPQPPITVRDDRFPYFNSKGGLEVFLRRIVTLYPDGSWVTTRTDRFGVTTKQINYPPGDPRHK